MQLRVAIGRVEVEGTLSLTNSPFKKTHFIARGVYAILSLRLTLSSSTKSKLEYMLMKSPAFILVFSANFSCEETLLHKRKV